MTDPVKAYLNSVVECRMEIRRCRRKLEMLEARAMSITSQLTGMPRGGSADRDAVLAALADASAEYYARLRSAELRELEVGQLIDSIPDQTYRIILRLRYLERKRWPDILSLLHKEGICEDRSWMFRLHGKALNAARIKYKERYPYDETGDP